MSRLLLLPLLLCGVALAQPGGTASLILTCRPTREQSVHLKLVVLNAGREFAPDAAVRVEFTGATARTVPLPAGQWSADAVAVLDLGEFSLAPPCPPEVEVRGGFAGEATAPLGMLRREPGGVRFTRACPGDARKGLLLAAVYEPLDDRQFAIKLACFNCGEKLAEDQDLFLHFELAPTASDLPATTALGLYPNGKTTDSSAWHEGDMAVAQLGPYALPDSPPEFIYLRAGLYNRLGDGARVPLVVPDDTNRALVGRLVTRDGKTWFERAPLGCTEVPEGWMAAKGGGE